MEEIKLINIQWQRETWHRKLYDCIFLFRNGNRWKKNDFLDTEFLLFTKSGKLAACINLQDETTGFGGLQWICILQIAPWETEFKS